MEFMTFVELLAHLRDAKNWSLAEAVKMQSSVGIPEKDQFSKSTLAVMEAGSNRSIKKSVFEALAKIYSDDNQTNYDDIYRKLVTKWMDYQFLSGSETTSLVLDDNSEKVTLKNPLMSKKGVNPKSLKPIEIISLSELQRRQGQLQRKDRVYVLATDFLDDDIFEDMVVENLQKGVRYYYGLPQNAYEDFRLWIDSLETKLGIPSREIIKTKAMLIGDETSDPALRELKRLPVNYVIHKKSDETNELEAYIGLLHGNRPQYYMRGDDAFAQLLYHQVSNIRIKSKPVLREVS